MEKRGRMCSWLKEAHTAASRLSNEEVRERFTIFTAAVEEEEGEVASLIVEKAPLPMMGPRV